MFFVVVPIKTALLFVLHFNHHIILLSYVACSLLNPSSISPKPVDSILYLENLTFLTSVQEFIFLLVKNHSCWFQPHPSQLELFWILIPSIHSPPSTSLHISECLLLSSPMYLINMWLYYSSLPLGALKSYVTPGSPPSSPQTQSACRNQLFLMVYIILCCSFNSYSSFLYLTCYIDLYFLDVVYFHTF